MRVSRDEKRMENPRRVVDYLALQIVVVEEGMNIHGEYVRIYFDAIFK